jgi:hypothetical protein
MQTSEGAAMAMLIGVRKWAERLGSGWTELLEQGLLIHTGDAGISGRGEGRGGLSGGKEGLSWVLVGALGGPFSRRIGKVKWSELTSFSIDEDSKSISLGYAKSGRQGRVTFMSDLDPYSERRSGPRRRFLALARQMLPQSGWGDTGGEVAWYRSRPEGQV